MPVPKRPDNQAWRYWRTVAGAAAAIAIVAIGAFTGHVRFAHANDVVDCAQVKCVALTFDDGPTPYTDRLRGILTRKTAHRHLLQIQIKPGSVVLLHDTYSSTVDLVYQFIPVLKANNYHLVTVSQLLGQRAQGSVYGRRENGPPANDLRDVPAAELP